jgi:hypothetical protein
MQNRYFTTSLALLLLLTGVIGRAEAKSRHFSNHFGGSGVNGVIDTNGDGLTANVYTGIANTNLGGFLFQGESEVLPALATNVNCPAGTEELPLLQAHTVLTDQKTGEQLFLTYTSGTACLDPASLTFIGHEQGSFSGGTGRFVHAAGTFAEDDTGSVLVFDLPAFHDLSNITGTLTGTITGLGESGD